MEGNVGVNDGGAGSLLEERFPHFEPSGRFPLEGPSEGLSSDGIHLVTTFIPVARLMAASSLNTGTRFFLLDRPLQFPRRSDMLSTRNKILQPRDEDERVAW